MKVFIGLILLLSLQNSLVKALLRPRPGLSPNYTFLRSGDVSDVPYSTYYDEETNSIFYADQYDAGAKICRHDIRRIKTFCAKVTGQAYAAGIIPIEGTTNEFVVGLQSSLARVSWDGTSNTASVIETLFTLPAGVTNFMDTVQVDPNGRVLFGPYGGKIIGSENDNIFYSYTRSEGVRELYSGYQSCFGVAFDNDKAFFVDSAGYVIYQFDYSAETGVWSNPQVAFRFDVKPGETTYLPYGLTIDASGNLYTGSYGGSSVLRINRQGGKIGTVDEIKLPYNLVGYPEFGGKNYDVLYVTLCALNLDLLEGRAYPKETNRQPYPASLVKIENTGFRGVKTPRIRL